MRPDPTHPTVWTVDVPELDRAVDVPVHADRSPSFGEVLAALDTDEERALVHTARTARLRDLASAPAPPPPEHVCVSTCVMNCCPGCGDGCGKCEPYIPCKTREIGCVMPADHAGGCVPDHSPGWWTTKERAGEQARPLITAGIPHTVEEHHGRYRVRRELDPQVPDSGRYRRRLTLFNRRQMIAWLGDGLAGARTPDDPGSDPASNAVLVDTPDGRAVIMLGDVVARTPTGFRIRRAERSRPATTTLGALTTAHGK